VELVLVVDNKVFNALDKNFTKVHQHCKDIANIINAVSGLLTHDEVQYLLIRLSLTSLTALRSAKHLHRIGGRRCVVGTESGRLVERRR